MIVFCTKQPGGTLTFREPVEADFAGSLARRQWIPPKSKQEIQYASIVSEQDAEDVELILHKGQEQKLEKYHPESAAKHWEIMRTVMPAAVWELW